MLTHYPDVVTWQIQKETLMGELEMRTRMVGAPVVTPPACLRCGSVDTLRLEKARVEANTCYRCRGCGHIFSPVGD